MTEESGPAPVDASEPSAAEVDAREDDLREGLQDLSGLVAGAHPLVQLLSEVAGAAVHAVSGADGAGVTLLRLNGEKNRVQALGASHEFISAIDTIQYEVVDEGPCITAALERQPVMTGSVGTDPRWPRFGPRVARLGVHSVLSLPLLLPDGSVVGALNAYARDHDVFDEHSATIGQLFARPAGVAVHNAHVLEAAQTRADQLQTAMITRAVIDQAIGIVRARSGIDAAEAFARLRSISQNENVKLSVIAERVVDEAVRRARARRGDG